ncbi:MAG: hypothetical protein A2W99_07790 [Bacteroidetes bacterium GWF2_33_16]|nr:MAG: hypothetical protein A2X00_10845 [Bacteroidetes bacterium GWE2_32_14]OFY03677.1 MAG: hypothetical protein A2W99_07790 [Bacteroidetes bacterium GWF2_33_16]
MQNKFSFYNKIPVQIRFNDFDFLAHVNNSVYQNYYDLARTKYIDEVFKEKMEWNTRGLVLVKVSIEFLRPILMDDNVDVYTKIYKLGNKSLGMYQQIKSTLTSELKSTCDSVMVAYCGDVNTPCPVPEDWRQKIIRFEKDIKF